MYQVLAPHFSPSVDLLSILVGGLRPEWGEVFVAFWNDQGRGWEN